MYKQLKRFDTFLLAFFLFWAGILPCLFAQGSNGTKGRAEQRAGSAPQSGPTLLEQALGKGLITAKGVPTITEKSLLGHVAVLAADSLEGREAGKPGQKKAARYIANTLAGYGLLPAFAKTSNIVDKGVNVISGQSDYYQPFAMRRLGLFTCEVVADSGAALSAGVELCPLVERTCRIDTELVSLYLGGVDFSLADPMPMDANSSINRPDVGGKAVFVYDSTGSSHLEAHKGYVGFIARMRAAGARSVFIALEFKGLPIGYMRLLRTMENNSLMDTDGASGIGVGDGGSNGQYFPAFVTTRKAMERLLGMEAYSATHTGAFKSPLVKKIRINLDVQAELLYQTENVGAYLPGKNTKQGVVLSAHYDHLGVDNGVVYNGADDDGSGTAGVLEMARCFAKAAKEGWKPERSIYFMFFTAEEKGLVGSDYFTRHSAIELDSISANLNVDMIGRVDTAHERKGNTRYLYTIGSAQLSNALDVRMRAVNKVCCGLELDGMYDAPDHPERLYYRSDHYNFARFGVPIAFFTTGLHADYHKPSDDIENLNLPKLRDGVRFIYQLAWDIGVAPTLLHRDTPPE
jgi:hypothetical protein